MISNGECKYCKKVKGIRILRRELNNIMAFYQQQPANQTALDLAINYQAVTTLLPAAPRPRLPFLLPPK